MALSRTSPWVAVSHHRALWSPDFPQSEVSRVATLPPQPPAAAARPTHSLLKCRELRNPTNHSGDIGSKTPDEGDRTVTEWHLQIYLVSDLTAQDVVSGLLAGIDCLVVETARSDFDSFVIVESPGRREAREVGRLVEAIDPGVKLIHARAIRPVEPTRA